MDQVCLQNTKKCALFLMLAIHLWHYLWTNPCREEYEVLKEVYDRPDPPLSEEWKVNFEIVIHIQNDTYLSQGYVIMAHAVIDPQAAYEEALQLQR